MIGKEGIYVTKDDQDFFISFLSSPYPQKEQCESYLNLLKLSSIESLRSCISNTRCKNDLRGFFSSPFKLLQAQKYVPTFRLF